MKDLKELRKQSGMNQFVVARESKVSLSRLSRAECGELQLKPVEEMAIRKAIRVGVARESARLRQLISEKPAKPAMREPSAKLQNAIEATT